MTSDPNKPPRYGEPLDRMPEADRKHFVFASVLLFGCVFLLPVAGALYVLMVRWG